MIEFLMAYQGVEGRWAQRGSLPEFNIKAKSLFLHCIMHVPWFLEPDLRKHKLSR